jgi:MFS family permease
MERITLAQFLGLKRSMLGLLAMVVLVGLGEKMTERFLPLYLVALGGGTLAVGLLNGLNNLIGALYSYIGGYVSDRWGVKRALLLFNLLCMFGFGLVIFFPSWKVVLVGAVFFLSWTAISLPATMGLVSKVLPKDKRTMGVSMHSLVRRFPMALGPLMGGLFISLFGTELGIRLGFCAALFMAILAAAFQQIWIEPDDRGPAPRHNPLKLFALMRPELKDLLVSDILIRFCEQVPFAFVVLWCVERISRPVSAFQFGILSAIEMGTAVLIYLPVAYFADKTKKKPFVVLTFVFFTLFPVTLLLSHSFWPLAGAFVLRGLKEFGEPTRKALIMDLAPDNLKASMFGLYYLIRDLIVSVAAFGGAFLWEISPAANFMAAALCGLAGTIWFVAKGAE